MPKKTREQKMASELRRLKRQASPQKSWEAPKAKAVETRPTIVPSTGYNVSEVRVAALSSKEASKTEIQSYDYSYVTSDLKKIVILSTLTITFEVVLNLTMRLEFANLLLRRLGIDI